MNKEPITPEVLPPQAVAVRENATELMKRTTDVAGVCKEIVLKCACNIQGKKYVKCEGWMAIATAHGCIAGSRDVKKVEGGWTAIGEIRRIHDGVLLAQAEGFVGQDEKRWGKANEYACRAMAQTRAISRACRAAFAHVVVLMDAGLSTTPFEEIPEEGFQDAPKQPQTRPTPEPPQRPVQTPKAAPSPVPDAGKPYLEVIVPKFIKKWAGCKVGEMDRKDLEWWAQNYEPKPYKGVIQQADLDFKAALEAAYADLLELQKVEQPDSDEPPY